MSNPPWTELITMETLPNDDLKFLASLVGLQPIIYLMCEYPGTTYTVPKNATMRARRDYVKNIMMDQKALDYTYAEFVIFLKMIFIKL